MKTIEVMLENFDWEDIRKIESYRHLVDIFLYNYDWVIPATLAVQIVNRLTSNKGGYISSC
jgi:hypothetical protein